MKKTYKLKGMTCNSCAMLIEKSLKDKVNSVSASFSKEKAEVDFDENKISEEEIIEEIEKLGYEIEKSNKEPNKRDLIETPKVNYSESHKKPKKQNSASSDKFGLFFAILSFLLLIFVLYYFFIGNIKFLKKFTMKASANAKGPYKGPIVTGLLNGLFIACGPLQAMYLYAAGTGSFSNGATALAVFGLGTLPVMIGFGAFASVISHKTTQKILKISAVIVLILGLIMLNRGLSMIGSPYSFSAIQSKLAGNPIASGTEAVLTNGVQEVNMDVSGSGYSPNSFVLKKGVPVKWNVNVKQLTGCNQELLLSQYGIDKNLKEGLNIIEFTPDKVGAISFTCGMGMLRGSFIVTESGTASQEQVKAATPPKGMQCGGSSGGGCGCGG